MIDSLKNTQYLTLNPSSGYAHLADWGVIFVEGEEAASFLQNQLTNSVLDVSTTHSAEIAQGPNAVRLVGYCSPKGRLLASAWLARFSMGEMRPTCFALFISKDIAASTAKRLSMYVLRSKVKVTDVSDTWNIAGFYGSETELETIKHETHSLALRMPDVDLNQQSFARALIATPKDLSSVAQETDNLEQWNFLEVMSAIPRIVLATQEQFVPQMINFESVAGVDFKKGCYPGQEIVARSQYRGAIKRRLQLARLGIGTSDQAAFGPGVELFNSADPLQPAGMVVLSVVNPQGLHAVNLQIECKLDALGHSEIHLGKVDGPVLKIDALPYPLIEI